MISSPFNIQHRHKNSELAFRNHPQQVMLVDTLSRKYHHHAILNTDFSERMIIAYLESLLCNLQQDHIPPILRASEITYFDLESHSINDDELNKILLLANHSNKCLLLAIQLHSSQTNLIIEKFDKLINHAQCRLLIIGKPENAQHAHYLQKYFSQLTLDQPSDEDTIALLKQHRVEMESFHHIIIPEDTLTHAYNLAGRYLTTNHVLEEALLLLDSSAARLAATELANSNNQYKPVLSATMLAAVLSDWTQIPSALLQSHKFKSSEFHQGMELRIFGQETALSIITHKLQQALIRTQASTGPFCSFLFAGPEHAGKKTTAVALAEQMFKHSNTLYSTQLASAQTHSIADVKLQRYQDRHRIPFSEVIQQTPYAVIVFENIEQASSVMLNELYEILSTGYLYVNQRSPLNLHQAIIILTTTLASEKIIELTSASTQENSSDINLLQLIMDARLQESHAYANLSPHEFALEIASILTAYLPPLLCKHTHVVPFIAANKKTAENILNLKVNALTKQLETRYRISLICPPDAIHHLAQEAIATNMDKILKQLYFTVEQAIVHRIDDAESTNQLCLQLHDSGKSLKCDWVSHAAMA